MFGYKAYSHMYAALLLLMPPFFLAPLFPGTNLAKSCKHGCCTLTKALLRQCLALIHAWCTAAFAAACFFSSM
jgi:hypothetical protein